VQYFGKKTRFLLYATKKTRPKIGRELINQGASTKLVSGISTPLSGQFGFFTADHADGVHRGPRNRVFD